MSHIHYRSGLEEIEQSQIVVQPTEQSPATFEHSEHFKYSAAQRSLARIKRYVERSWIERRQGKFVVVSADRELLPGEYVEG